MVNNCCNMLKEPLMWTIIKKEHLVITVETSTQFTPSFGYESSNSSRLNRFKDDCCNLIGILNNDTSETNVHWRGSIVEKELKVRFWTIRRRISEEETTNVYIFTSISVMRTRTIHSPMCDGQSVGRGTSAGDQQYVWGTRRACASRGPSVTFKGARPMVALHELTISPRLQESAKVQRITAAIRTLALATSSNQQ